MFGINNSKSDLDSGLDVAGSMEVLSSFKGDIFDCVDPANLFVENYKDFLMKKINETMKDDQNSWRSFYKNFISEINDSDRKEKSLKKFSYHVVHLINFLYEKRAEKSVMSKLLQSDAVVACRYASKKLMDLFYNNVKENKISKDNIKKLYRMFSKNLENSTFNQGVAGERPKKPDYSSDWMRCMTDDELNKISDTLISDMDNWDEQKRIWFHKTWQIEFVNKYFKNNKKKSTQSSTKIKDVEGNHAVSDIQKSGNNFFTKQKKPSNDSHHDRQNDRQNERHSRENPR